MSLGSVDSDDHAGVSTMMSAGETSGDMAGLQSMASVVSAGGGSLSDYGTARK